MSFAYLFERFPSFSQTFCVREVVGVRSLAGNVPVFSIRRPSGEPEQNYPEEAETNITYLPEDIESALRTETVKFGAMLQRWYWLRKLAREKDRRRAFEALWLGPRLLAAGITHVHAHFAGIGARTAWWLKRFYGIQYSFTAHANDIFVKDKDAIVLRLMEEAVFVVTETQFSVDFLKRKFPAVAGKVVLVYNGLDVGPEPVREPSAGCQTLLTVGRYIEKKGYDYLIGACALLGPRPFTCEIVGHGPLEESLQKKIDSLALGDRVRLAGPRSQAQISEMSRTAKLFVLPCVNEGSGGSDNLPTAIMDAMAAGLPVISTRVAGIPELVLDGETGILVEEKSVEALATAIATLLDNPALAARMGANGRRHAAGTFDIRTVSKQLFDHLKSHGATATRPPSERPRCSGRLSA